MSIWFYGEGNIGTDPTAREVNVNGETFYVLGFRVFFDNKIRQANGEFQDKEGFWANVEQWGDGKIARLSKIYAKGMRVMVTGKIRFDQWESKDKEARVTAVVRAKRIGILPSRIEQIVYRSGGNKDSGSD